MSATQISQLQITLVGLIAIKITSPRLISTSMRDGYDVFCSNHRTIRIKLNTSVRSAAKLLVESWLVDVNLFKFKMPSNLAYVCWVNV